ncbi:hypothetical protein [Rubidibacter lacunae]|nr:hypothetical protein [Rubidibacter lacunae]
MWLPVVENPTYNIIDADTRSLVDRLLLERISTPGIAHAVKVTEQWPQD